MQSELKQLILQQACDKGTDGRMYDMDNCNHISLEESGLEENTDKQPIFGFNNRKEIKHDDMFNEVNQPNHDVIEYVTWFSDGEDSRWEMN